MIPDSVRTLGGGCFSSCTSLTEITVPDGVEKVGDNPFSWCFGLDVHVSPDHPALEAADGVLIRKEDRRLLSFLSVNTESCAVPEGTVSIGEQAFIGAPGLKSVDVPEGVTEIGDFAFSICGSLTRVSLPASVSSIGGNAFYACPEELTVTAPRGSYAARFCAEKGIACVETD